VEKILPLAFVAGLFVAFNSTQAAPKQILLLGQKPDGHPPGTHEYMAGARVLKALLAHRQDLRTTIAQADEPWVEGPALIAKATK
jgi:HEPN domain-containing protein